MKCVKPQKRCMSFFLNGLSGLCGYESLFLTLRKESS